MLSSYALSVSYRRVSSGWIDISYDKPYDTSEKTKQRYKLHVYDNNNRGIGHVNVMQFFTGISRYTQSKSYMLSLTECVWESQNNALWDNN